MRPLDQDRIGKRVALVAAWIGAISGLGCASPYPRPRFADEQRASSSAGVDAATNVRVSLEGAPTHAVYQRELLAAERKSVGIVVINDGAQDIAAEELVVRFRARREGVEFPCGEPYATEAEREPGVLRPGQSHTFRRDIDCNLSLPGRYDVEVFVTVARSEPARFIGRFPFVVDAGKDGPHPLPSMPGVFAIMVGADVVEPLSQEAWAKGDYRVALAVTNGSNEMVRLPKGRLAFLTFKKGSPLPCSGESEPIELDAEIAPGRNFVARVPLACAPSEVGRYEVLGRLTFDDGSEGTDVGRFWLKVKRDPVFDTPSDPPYLDRAGRVLW
jgi:hypothetical protein